ncbi:hypothetical protein J437_LFUL002560 [Ladona fulva]|uniref:Uncharacterized protein n=1 Tax=Ladona fulva TaxID=123851 RepID=A0A8K0JVN1_LADFU|nr:hypothetical protein J437_LFUL002560 [Ladona fulva]
MPSPLEAKRNGGCGSHSGGSRSNSPAPGGGIVSGGEESRAAGSTPPFANGSVGETSNHAEDTAPEEARPGSTPIVAAVETHSAPPPLPPPLLPNLHGSAAPSPAAVPQSPQSSPNASRTSPQLPPPRTPPASSWHPHVYAKPPSAPTPHFIADILGWQDGKNKVERNSSPAGTTTLKRAISATTPTVVVPRPRPLSKTNDGHSVPRVKKPKTEDEAEDSEGSRRKEGGEDDTRGASSAVDEDDDDYGTSDGEGRMVVDVGEDEESMEPLNLTTKSSRDSSPGSTGNRSTPTLSTSPTSQLQHPYATHLYHQHPLLHPLHRIRVVPPHTPPLPPPPPPPFREPSVNGSPGITVPRRPAATPTPPVNGRDATPSPKGPVAAAVPSRPAVGHALKGICDDFQYMIVISISATPV